jgi:5-methylcytosine-specific restriction endonuclease McrA
MFGRWRQTQGRTGGGKMNRETWTLEQREIAIKAGKLPNRRHIRNKTRERYIKDTRCLYCTSSDKLQFHHLSYAYGNVGDVVTLCQSCHLEVHRTMSKGATERMIKGTISGKFSPRLG